MLTSPLFAYWVCGGIGHEGYADGFRAGLPRTAPTREPTSRRSLCGREQASETTFSSRALGTTSTRPCSDARDARFAMAKEEPRERWARRSTVVRSGDATGGQAD